jgi:hypothetical protein
MANGLQLKLQQSALLGPINRTTIHLTIRGTPSSCREAGIEYKYKNLKGAANIGIF